MRAAPTLREWLREGPYGLSMSSGFFAFFAHTGLVQVLEDEGLLPARMSGSSAGALVAGSWASGMDATPLAAELRKVTRSDFWDPELGAGLLRGKRFRAKLRELLPGKNLEDGRLPVSVSVWNTRTRRTEVLTTGEVARAIHASCAVPLMFHPVRIGEDLYLDGGILDRPGLAGMPDRERVLLHHIPSRPPLKRPWRVPLPSRPGMQTLVIHGLPKPGPFALEEGHRAIDVARRAMKEALDRPSTGTIEITFR